MYYGGGTYGGWRYYGGLRYLELRGWGYYGSESNMHCTVLYEIQFQSHSIYRGN